MADRRKRYVWDQAHAQCRATDSPVLFWECRALDPVRLRIFHTGSVASPGTFDVPCMPTGNGTGEKWTGYVYAVQEVDGREVHHSLAYCTEYANREEAEASARILGRKYSRHWPSILAAWSKGFFTEFVPVSLTSRRRDGMQLVVVDDEGKPLPKRELLSRFEPKNVPPPKRKQSAADRRSRHMSPKEAKQEVREALEACDGDVNEASRLLGIKFPSSLYKKLRDLGINYADYRPDDWEERRKATKEKSNGNGCAPSSPEETEQITREALEACNGDAMEAANLLGINFGTVYQRIKEYGIDQEEYKA